MRGSAQRFREVPRSGIREFRELASRHADVIRLEVGEPSFPTPHHIIEEAGRAAQNGHTRITDSAGLRSLRQLLAEKIRRENHYDAGEQNVVVTPGSLAGLSAVLYLLLQANDEVLVPSPSYPNYAILTALFGARAIHYPLDPSCNFRHDLLRLESLVSPRTRVLVVNSPGNPTGAVMPTQAILDLVQMASDHDLWILSDETYEKFAFDLPHHSPAAFGCTDRTIGLYSFSKTYAMTGWRIGYVVTERNLASEIATLQEVTLGCASSVSQKAAEAAVQGPQDCVAQMASAYRCRREKAIEILSEYSLLTHYPEGAFYFMVDVSSTRMDSGEFARSLLHSKGVAVAPGGTFGPSATGYVRVSIAAEGGERLTEGLRGLCHHVQQESCA